MTTASQPMDKRMLRTREAIRCALLSLLNQKDASQINVSELTEKAADQPKDILPALCQCG